MIPLATIAQYASQIAGEPISISCDGLVATDDEYVMFYNGRAYPVIHLRPRICSDLMNADSTPYVLPGEFLDLEHGAQHIALNSTDECLVERTALANIWQIVRRFRLAAWRTKAILSGAPLVDRALPAAYHPDANGAC